MKLKNELLPYQKNAVEKLRKVKVGALFMEQGTGKTITALELYRLRMDEKKVDGLVWLCPCAAKQNIKEEMFKQLPEEMLKNIIVCGIESLSTSIRLNSYLLQIIRDGKKYLVVDESLLIKNPYAYRTRNIDRLAEHCQYKLILNGTPISRNEADLYSQFHMLDWRILGYKSYWSFAANHIEYDEKRKKIVRCLNTDVLAEKIEPYAVEIKKSECLVLPPKIYHTKYFRLTKAQNEQYEWVADKLLMEIDEFRPETIYRLFAGLQAVISGFRVGFQKGKNGYEHMVTSTMFENPMENPRIQAAMEEIDGKEKVIIFCNYTKEVENLCTVIGEKYGKDAVARYDGRISQRKRDENLKRFKERATFLIANRGCAGYSLNLQFCNNIIYFSNNWDLATKIQSEDRVHRIGQKEQVWITNICAWQTIDERIVDCLNRKERLLDSFREEIQNMEQKNDIKKWLNTKKGSRMILDLNKMEEAVK